MEFIGENILNSRSAFQMTSQVWHIYQILNGQILEETSNMGGAAIFMAGGSKHNASWEYEKKQ